MKISKKLIHKIISKNIKENSKVLDLGCGDGTFLKYLITSKKVKGHGIELNKEAIIKSIEKGISVIHQDLNNLPLDFQDKSYDTVTLNQTLQQVNHPEKLVEEMLRIGKEGILSFPNFGYWKVRWQFFITGKMPITKELPDKWYNTQNIKLFTIKDFYIFCKSHKIRIIEHTFLQRTKKGRYKFIKLFPNYRADLAIFRLSKDF